MMEMKRKNGPGKRTVLAGAEPGVAGTAGGAATAGAVQGTVPNGKGHRSTVRHASVRIPSFLVPPVDSIRWPYCAVVPRDGI
jgi:hypothetical protein